MVKSFQLMFPSKFRFLMLGFLISLSLITNAQKNAWPHEIETDNGTKIVIYQPQPETLKGINLESRAAISVKTKDAKEPVFGAIWLNCILQTDRDSRMASLESVKVTDVRFPNNPDSAKIKTLKNLIETEVPKWDLIIDMDVLNASIETENGVNLKSELIKNDAPEIIYEKTVSVLITIDGEPKLQDIEKTGVKRILNTPFIILQDQSDKLYYLNGNGIWYTSTTYKSDWKRADKLSPAIQKISKDLIQSKAIANPDSVDNTVIPKIIVRTVPADLVQTNGDAEFVPIKSSNLLYAKNTEDDIFMDISSQKYYILVAGRWYTAASMNGPWAFTPSDKLPADFAKIPVGSSKDNVLASVAGTEQAIDAIHDAQVPQTATVDRKTATTTVTYDGEPKFEKVKGTPDLLYAVNTSSTVLKYKDTYYAVDNGIWFASSSAKGPWKVSTERPKQVEDIEPESPVYNVKYVYIYDSTPEVVYVGYTPGYMGSYMYGPTIVYGTGYYYQPWYGAYYYPRPVTYGLGVHYNPWTGWSVGLTMSVGGPYGWMSFGFHTYPSYWGPHYGGFYGPAFHYPPPYYHCNHHYGNSPVVINNVNIRNNNYYNRSNNTNIKGNNIYKNREGIKPGNLDKPAIGGNLNNGNISRPSNKDVSSRPKQNNQMFADKSGNVYKGNTADNLQKHDGKTWSKPETKPNISQQGPTRNTPQQANKPDYNHINQQMQNRNTGSINNHNFNQYRQQTGGYNGGGRAGGGGGFGGAGGGGMRRR